MNTPNAILGHTVFVGTHHKAGTVWLQTVFAEICKHFGLTMCVCSRSDKPDEGCNVILNYHSVFDSGYTLNSFKGTHMIRDPRDIIVSGCFYHKSSDEWWLFKPFDRLGGSTYHDKINSLKNLDDQLLLEMEIIAPTAIGDMITWNYQNPLFLELKYEHLIKDTNLEIFRKLFTFLGFPDKLMPSLLELAYNHSVFSPNFSKTSHIRSGATQQWKQYFKPVHKKRFLELFGDALVTLGYEPDNSWIDE